MAKAQATIRLGRQAKAMAGNHSGNTNKSFGSLTGLKNSENMRRLGEWLASHGLNRLDHIKTRHLETFFREKIDAGLGRSALEGYMTAATRLLENVGKPKIVENLRNNPELMAQIRRGTSDRLKPVLPNRERIEQITRELADRATWQGYAHELMRGFGLREKEALLSCGTLERDGKLRLVIRGTKGGRPRDIEIRTCEQLDLVVRVQRYIDDAAKKSLIPTDMSLKQAVKRMSNDLYRLGATKNNAAHGHAARHAYAQTRLEEGTSWREVAEELGHGREFVVRHYAHLE